MKRMASRVAERAGWWGVLVVLTVPLPAWGYTPSSPEVRKMVERGVAFLNQDKLNGRHSGKLGGQAVIGLAVYKYDKRFGSGGTQVPQVTQVALDRVKAAARVPRGLAIEDNYSIGLALIFLTEVEPTEHTLEISVYLDELKQRQKPNGAWGYNHDTRGDTSQLQYAVLGAWAARAVGMDFPRESMIDVLNYLLRVQDPSGAFGYQGTDPGTFVRVPQEAVRPSLAAAGLGSVYVAADFLGLSKDGPVRTISQTRLPAVLIPVSEEDRGGRRPEVADVEVARVRQSMNDGNNWFRQNPAVRTTQWQYYFLYGYERYHSFREKVEGTFEEEPRWYNDGVRLLRELQNDDGSWGSVLAMGESATETDAPVSTAFATLFLLRSTRETIEKVIDRDGILRGGHELPSDLSDVRLRDHRIVAPAITGEVEDLITMLEDGDGEKIERLLEDPDVLALGNLDGSGREYAERLGRILRSGSYQARMLAARTLGRQGTLDNVPFLIYALTDGDPRVVREAQFGLRLISRKFDGVALAEQPGRGEVDAAVRQWKTWYLSVRPDAVFID